MTYYNAAAFNPALAQQYGMPAQKFATTPNSMQFFGGGATYPTTSVGGAYGGGMTYPAFGNAYGSTTPAFDFASLFGGGEQDDAEAVEGGGDDFGGESFAQLQSMMASVNGIAASNGIIGQGNPERFIQSEQGGVIVGADGTATGTVPPGSFVDTKTGAIHKADGTKLEIPSGGSVDFFDLPDVEGLVAAFNGTGATPTTTPVAGGGPMQKAGHEGCDPAQGHSHGTTQVGGAHGSGATGATPAMKFGTAPTKVGGVSGGGVTTAVGGVNNLGQSNSLESSIAQLIAVLRELASAMAAAGATTGGGAAPGKLPAQFPGQIPGQHGHPHVRPDDKAVLVEATPSNPTPPPSTTVPDSTDSTTVSGSADSVNSSSDATS